MDINEYGKSNIVYTKKFAENRDRTLTQNAFIRRIAKTNGLQIKDADVAVVGSYIVKSDHYIERVNSLLD